MNIDEIEQPMKAGDIAEAEAVAKAAGMERVFKEMVN